ncbi:MAG: MoxR family ATPase [candidate division NC10 bacterium]|nr:MoxR family ATPase [candidate division NC10 bacterium]
MTELVSEVTRKVKEEMAKAVVGQGEVIDQILIGLLAKGHVLLEGVPGTAKTLIAKALAFVLGARYRRIQFTPDLMPSDILGTNVFDLSTSTFSFKPGPVFTDILLADEINRTPPKTQAALLEAMEERQVTIDGTTHPLPPLFIVLATQNPVEYEGTYPLPEAQLDRFLLKVLIAYPDPEEERQVVSRHHQGFDPHDLGRLGLRRLADPGPILQCRQEVQKVVVEEGVTRYIVEVIRRTRSVPSLVLGGSPRASVALLHASKALAAIRGKRYVTPDEVKEMAKPVLRHRVILRPEAEIEGVTADQVIEGLLSQVPVPR